MPRIVHFEIPAEDPDSLAAFYQRVFDWKIEKWDGPMNYWLVRTGDEGPGIDGAIMGRNPTHQTPVNILDVPSVTDYSERVVAEGGEVIAPQGCHSRRWLRCLLPRHGRQRIRHLPGG